MAMIQITANELEEKKYQLQKLNDELKQEIEELNRISLSLKHDWEGEAADAYQDNSRKQVKKLMDAVHGVQRYIKALDRIIIEYKTTESINVCIAKH